MTNEQSDKKTPVENDVTVKAKKPWTFKRILLVGLLCLGMIPQIGLAILFVNAILNGYLSWIGITVGTVLFGSMFLSLVLPRRKRKRIVKLTSMIPIVLIITIIALGFFMSYWPDTDTSWRVYRFDDELASIEQKRAVPAEENAATYYEPLFAGINIEEEPNFLSSNKTRTVVLEEADKLAEYPEIDKWLNEYAEIIEGLVPVCQMAECRFPANADRFGEDSIPYKKFRRAAQMLIIAGNKALSQGDRKQALEKYFCAINMARHLYQQPEQISFYVGFDLEWLALKQLNSFAVRAEATDEELDLIREKILPCENKWSHEWLATREIKKLQYKNLFGEMYEINDKGRIRFRQPDFTRCEDDSKSRKTSGLWRVYLAMSMPLNPSEIYKFVDPEYAKVDVVATGDCVYTYEPTSPSVLSINFMSRVTSNFLRWIIESMELLRYDTSRFHCMYLRQLGRRRGTFLVIATTRYRNNIGEWPGVVSDIAEMAPAEAIVDPVNGQPFGYKIEQGGFMLYSKGFNGVDEGGFNECGYWPEPNKADDIAIWPRAAGRREAPSDANEG